MMHKHTNHRAIKKGQEAQEKILNYIIQSFEDTERVSGPNFLEIGNAVGLHASSVSYHVKNMMKSRRLFHETEGLSHFYSLTPFLKNEEITITENSPAPPSATAETPVASKETKRAPLTIYPSFEAIHAAESLSSRFLMAAADKNHATMALYLHSHIDALPLPKRKAALEIAFSFAVLQRDPEGTTLIRGNAYKADLKEADLAAIAKKFERADFYATLAPAANAKP